MRKAAPVLAVVVLAGLLATSCAGDPGRRRADSLASGIDRTGTGSTTPIDINSALNLPRTLSGSPVVVALLDTPIDSTVPALKGRILGTRDVISSASAGPERTVHGTEMASLIAARPEAGSSVHGVAPNSLILSIPIVDGFSAEPSAVVSGLREALRARAEVIVLAYGASTWPSQVQDALREAVSDGAIPVLSAGNRGGDSLVPAIEGTLVAASVNLSTRTLEAYSGPATTRGFVLPGGEASPHGQRVPVLAPGGRSDLAAGTSVSTAALAGIVALLEGAVPGAQPTMIIGCLQETAKDMGPAGPDAVYGYGMPDVTAAVSCLQARSGGST